MSDPITTALAATFRAEMARQQIKQAHLAKMTGLSQSVVSRRLNAKDSMSMDEVTVIIDALGLDGAKVIAKAFDEAAMTQDQFGLVAHNPGVDIEAEQESTEENHP